MRTLRLLLSLLLLAGGSTAWATNYYVAAEGQSTPTPPWTNWGWAHTNLIEAVAHAGNGDTVYVTNNNTYYLTNEVSIAYSMTVRSWAPDGSLDRDATIINGNYPVTSNRCFLLNNKGAWVQGFTITNGYNYQPPGYGNWGGGGVRLEKGNLTNCVITGSRYHGISDGSTAGGGGIYAPSSAEGSVWNCTISRNTSYVSGGGIKLRSITSLLIANCTISDNYCSNNGGGFSSYNSAFVVTNCQIVSNSGGLGGGVNFSYYGTLDRCVVAGNISQGGAGGIYLIGANTALRHCMIYNNSSANNGGGVYMVEGKVENCVICSNYNAGDTGGGIFFLSGVDYVKNCIDNNIVWENRSGGAGVYSNCMVGSLCQVWATNTCIAQQSLGATYYPVNCISSDPRFVDAASANFRMQADSPCINAGTNRAWMSGAVDMDGRRRIDHFSGIVDMGAYEYLPQGSLFTSY